MKNKEKQGKFIFLNSQTNTNIKELTNFYQIYLKMLKHSCIFRYKKIKNFHIFFKHFFVVTGGLITTQLNFFDIFVINLLELTS